MKSEAVEVFLGRKLKKKVIMTAHWLRSNSVRFLQHGGRFKANLNVIPTPSSLSREVGKKGAPIKRLKVLYLAYPFPPRRATSCVRTWNTAKYLARSGWDVTVVTPHPSAWREVDDPKETDFDIKREGVRCILTRHRWRCLAPHILKCWNNGLGWILGGVCRRIAWWLGIDNGIGWIKEAERACSMLTAENMDVILATGSPFAAFKLAKVLSDRLGCPYVLDYRDPWTGNPHVAHPARPSTIKREAKLLEGCEAVTIVSRSWARAMERRFNLKQKLHVVTNGYDPEELEGVRPFNFGHFAIVYTGNFYPPKRVISPIMAALTRLKENINGQGREWYFHYFGRHGNHVREVAERYGVMDRVVLHGTVPRSEALSAVRGAGVSVIITSVGEDITAEDSGIVPGKVFESLGLGAPIMLVSPSGSDAESILATTGQGYSFAASNTDGMVSFLTDMIRGRPPELRCSEAYAWPQVGKQFDVVLRSVAASNGCFYSE